MRWLSGCSPHPGQLAVGDYMEILLIVIVLAILFGGFGYWRR